MYSWPQHGQRQSVSSSLGMGLLYDCFGMHQNHDKILADLISSGAIFSYENENVQVFQKQCTQQAHSALHLPLLNWGLVCVIPDE